MLHQYISIVPIVGPVFQIPFVANFFFRSSPPAF
jgi:hypothetical protein